MPAPEALQDNAPDTIALIDELGLERVDADPAARKRYILGGVAKSVPPVADSPALAASP